MTLHMRNLFLAVGITVFFFLVCATAAPEAKTQATDSDLYGMYLLAKESSGYSPAKNAQILLQFIAPDSLVIAATKPGVPSVTDTGTFSVKDGKITLSLPQLGRTAKDAAFTLKGQTLTLPILIIDDGEGTSTWQKIDRSHDPLHGPIERFKKAVLQGTSRAKALQTMAAELEKEPSVEKVQVLEGSSLLVTYKSGYQEAYLGTGVRPPAKQLNNDKDAPSSKAPLPLVEPAKSPGTIILASGRPLLAQLHLKNEDVERLKQGRFGLWLKYEPEPVSQNDAPRVKKGLVISAFHTLPVLIPGGSGLKYFSFMDKGENLNEVTRPLEWAGYTVTGPIIDADVTVSKLWEVFNQDWGVIYFNTHGGPTPGGDFILSTGEQVPYDQSITPQMREEFWDGYLDGAILAGLPPALRQHIQVGLIDDGVAFIAVKSGFFQAAAGDQSQALIYIGGCESTKTDTLRNAMKARVFLGWQEDMDMEAVSRINRYFWPVLSLKTRSGREAMDFTVNHMLEIEKYHNRGRHWDPRNLTLYRDGKNTYEKTLTNPQRRILMAVRDFACRKEIRGDKADLRSMVQLVKKWNKEEIPGAMKMGGTMRWDALGRNRVPEQEIDEVEGELCGYTDGTARFTLVENQ